MRNCPVYTQLTGLACLLTRAFHFRDVIRSLRDIRNTHVRDFSKLPEAFKTYAAPMATALTSVTALLYCDRIVLTGSIAISLTHIIPDFLRGADPEASTA